MLKRDAQSVTNPLDPPLSFWEGAIPASPPIASGMQDGHMATCLCEGCTALRVWKATRRPSSAPSEVWLLSLADVPTPTFAQRRFLDVDPSTLEQTRHFRWEPVRPLWEPESDADTS